MQRSPLIEGLLEAVWLVDPASLRIVAANAAAAVLQQKSMADLLGAQVQDCICSAEDHIFWQAAAEDGLHSLQSETVMERSDGSMVRVYRSVTPVLWPDGQAAYLVAMQDQTQQHEKEQQLETLLQELRAALESTADGILVCDLEHQIRACNRLFAQLWGMPETLLVRKDDAAVHAWLSEQVRDQAAYELRLEEIRKQPMLQASDLLLLHNGRILERITRPQLARGCPVGRVYVYRDITERSLTEAQLKLAAKVFESNLDAIFITDAAGTVLTCNPAAAALTAQSASTLQGQTVQLLFYAPAAPQWHREAARKLELEGCWEGEIWHRRADFAAVGLQASWVMLRDAQGQALNTVLIAKDLSDKLAAQQRIDQLAYTDALTGLPNRLMLTERVNHIIRLTQRSRQRFAVVFLDLDRFKSINDSLGHLFGDQVLVHVSRRLQSCLRQTDTLCRLGGDEFVLHLHDVDAAGAEVMSRRIIEVVARPVEIDGMNFTLSCSIGIALYPQDGQTLDELIRHADTAMYQVKDRGKGHYRFYQPQMNADLLARIQLDHALRESLPRQQFVLRYQPQSCLRTGALRSCEALLRWQHPEHGLLMPGQFIGVAEETGFIVNLGQWVLEEAVRQAAVWLAAGTPCRIAVNVSALQFQQAGMVQGVADALERHGLPAQWLELELTESILIHDAQEALERLQALEALGVQLSLDDFGTGFSSFAYLKRFGLHKIKIDRSFISSLHDNETDAALVAAMIQMGHALNMQVVAEGVELAEQRARLQALGCDQFQGFLLSRALSAEAFSALLARSGCAIAAAPSPAGPAP